MASRSTCQHVLHIQQFYEDSLKERAQGSCDSCLAKGPNFWLCLQKKCGYVGCGESAMDHSSEHTEKYGHFVALNLKSRRAWCADCDCEVFPKAIVHKEIEALVKTKIVREEIQETIMQQDIIRNPRCSPLLYRDSPVSEALTEYLQDETRVRGLTGLRNLGNTCYLNSGIQALSNCPPFTQFFLECDNFITTKKKPYIAQIYKRLMLDIWGRKRHGYMNPNSLVSSFKQTCPMFKGYTQQDAQEFLRCFMDRLHEELKEPITSEDDSEEEDERSPHAESPSVERKRSTRSSTEAAYSDSELSNRSDGEERRTRTRSRRQENRHRTISASHVELRTDGSDDGADQDGTPEADQAIVEAESGQGDSQVHGTHSHENITPRSKENRGKKRKAVKYQSIVSEVFDGKILSSVQCLTCLRESKCKETFQDLSLPIPGKEDLVRIQGMGSNKPNTAASCSTSSDGSGWWGWFASWFNGVSSWLYGPSITLDACLAAFFSQDDLKGDNMYSCEKCGKLRNGVKISKVQKLPEVLCIHLKRFRHDSFSSYSSKISNYVEFPIDNLDMSGYVSEDCSDECKIYDLTAVICHHGTAGGGHYTAYAQNWLNSRWFEFDDTYVTEVEEIAVMNAEAYVLFYRKKSEKAEELRQTVSQLCQQQEQSLIQFHISLKWLNKFNTFVEPGPITNSDFLCKHGAVPPHKAAVVDKLFVKVPQSVWEALHNRFGGGPVVNHLSLQPCLTCQAEIDQLTRRREEELSNFIKLHEAFTSHQSTGDIYYISLAWFNLWEAFVKAKEQDPPGPIDNKPIAIIKDGYVFNRPGGGSAQISEDTWKYLHSIYDGGPEIVSRSSRTAIADTPANDAEEEGVDEDDESTE